MRFSRVTRTLLVSLALVAAMLCLGVIAPESSSASVTAQQGCQNIQASAAPSFFSAQGGSGTIFVSNPSGCSWGVSTQSPFISLGQPSSNQVSFFVLSNSGPARSATITILVGGNIPVAAVGIDQAGISPVPLYRYWNPSMYNHFYTTDFGELGNGAFGYSFERVQCHVFATQVPGSLPLNRYYCPDSGDHFYTTNPNEPGPGLPCYQFERVECYVYPTQFPGTVPLYRYYEPNAVDHFYTTDFNELRTGAMGWYLEGIQCYVFP